MRTSCIQIPGGIGDDDGHVYDQTGARQSAAFAESGRLGLLSFREEGRDADA
jgi:hypothetical protein